VTIASIRRHLDGEGFIPTELALGNAYPNPFNDLMTVYYDIPEPTGVRITVHDASGRTVATLVNGYILIGRHPTTWNGLSDNGERAASGLYIIRLDTPLGRKMRKVALVR